MSYPHELQVLVVEDDDASKSFYNAAFEQLVGKGYPIAPLRYAFCHADGVTALSADTIYHLVILDLRLPRSPREPPVEGLDLGLDLLQRCADRNDYPVPTVLVISGHPDKMSQGGLAERVSAAFAHGQVLIKGASLNSLEGDIENAVRRSIAYCQVGLHVRDGGTDCFPTLSPRDVDLLRRAVIMQEGCIGLDLRWWSAEFDAPFEGDATFSGWTKTLMGGFLLGRGRGKSRPTFFKLAPNAGAESVAAEARLLQHKLSHIKVFPPITAGNRSLLMTQKVGEDDGAPVALAHFLGRPAGEVGGLIANVVQDVAGQVARLGDSSPNQEAVGKLLWRHHDSDRLAVQWKRWLAPDVLESLVASLDVTRVYGALRESQQMVRFGVQSALHGDLNATNIALDVRGELARGYIFDASGVAAGVNLRDLAMLDLKPAYSEASGGEMKQKNSKRPAFCGNWKVMSRSTDRNTKGVSSERQHTPPAGGPQEAS